VKMKLLRSAVIACALFVAVAAPKCDAMVDELDEASHSHSGYVQEAAMGVEALQRWYVPSPGLYETPTGWWNAANAMTVLADYSRVSGNNEYLPAIRNTFKNASKAKKTANFINEYDDDEGWWALAWIDAYDLTGSSAYLKMAETIFADMASEWDTGTCGGGIWWKKPAEYKNAIANELFLSVAASLANRTKGKKADFYKQWAEKEWAWFKGTGMINANHLVNDGLTSSDPKACVNNGHKTWSYNQGVILTGLVELAKSDKDATLILEAAAIANATIESLTTKGILVDSVVTGEDAPQFKGIFVRNLLALYKAAPDPRYKSFFEANADSIWRDDQGEKHEFGVHWEGPFDSGDATRQTSALDALIAAAAVQ
jgi:predicted alpha-1,6-mannanase (GH76 family)